MKRIWKYQLKLTESQAVEMPVDAQILTADWQEGKITLWALVDPSAGRVLRWISIAGTGWPLNWPHATAHQHIATLQRDGYVWHVFDGRMLAGDSHV